MDFLCLPSDLSEYLTLQQTTDVGMLKKFVRRGSEYFTNCCNHDTFFPTARAERRSGNGTNKLCPRYFPIIEMTSVYDSRVLIPPSTDVDVPGYFYRDFTLELTGSYLFTKGAGNILLSYWSGFGKFINETVTV